MAVTYISIERTTGAAVFEADQSDPPLTEAQAAVVAERYMTLLLDRLEEVYPEAEIEIVSGNGLGGGTRVEADDNEEENRALATISSISQSIYESDDLWGAINGA